MAGVEADVARVIGYRRVSKENGTGLGLKAQTTAINAAAKRLNARVSATYTDDGISGAAPIGKRLELLASLASLQPGDALVVARRDRLARDHMIAAWIEKEVRRRGARLISADGAGNGDGPMDKLLRTIINAFAEVERDLISARTRAALAAKRARGEATGGDAPFGFVKVGKMLIEDKAEQVVVGLMRDLRSRGAMLREISGKLAKLGHFNRVGQPFQPTAISRILSR